MTTTNVPGRKWSVNDEKVLFDLMREGASDESIGLALGRSVKAIHNRKIKLAETALYEKGYHESQDQKLADDIAAVYNISSTDLLNWHQKYNAKINQRNDPIKGPLKPLAYYYPAKSQ